MSWKKALLIKKNRVPLVHIIARHLNKTNWLFRIFPYRIFMFLFEWLKRDWWPKERCLHSKSIYLSTVWRITLTIAVDFQIVTSCTIWYHLRSLKNVKSTYGGVLLLAKKSCTFTKSDICFSRFSNCTNGTKCCKASNMF